VRESKIEGEREREREKRKMMYEIEQKNCKKLRGKKMRK
jgi:hypothetical protein